MYEIHVDRQRRLLKQILRGHWSLDDLEEFDRKRREAIAAAGWSSDGYNALVDLRDHGVQSTEVSERGREIMASPEVTAHRTAIVVSSALKKLQINRIATHENVRVFISEEEALQWLYSS